MMLYSVFKNLPIRVKFVVWFLLIALLPLIMAINITYQHSRKLLKEEAINTLVVVADNKANQIETYLGDKEKTVHTLAHMSDVVNAMDGFSQVVNDSGIDSEEYRTVEEEYKALLIYYQHSFGYENLYLASKEGFIVFSAKEVEGLRSLYEIALYKDSQLAKTFIKVKDSLHIEISDFEYNVKTKKGAVFLASPILKGSEFIGALILEMNNYGIAGILESYIGLGESGETIVASKIGNEIVYIAPIRLDASAAFKRRISIGSEQEPNIQSAVAQKEGLGLGIDYRGKEVFSVWRYLPTFRLGMLVKIDADEVFFSARSLRNKLLKAGIMLLIGVIVAAILLARSISKPIKALTDISGIIARGNLEVRAKVEAKDEIGRLAASFNKMTSNLYEAKVNIEQKNEQLQEQTLLLEEVNKELDSFVYTVSHDLRAPLRGITAFANFLNEDYKNKFDKSGKENLGEIIESAKRMNNLIDDLLKLSRISRIKNPYEDTNISLLIASVLKRIEFDIKESKVDLKIQENLPTLKCDSIKMSEVFLNLINNAIKFSSKNSKENPRVEVGCQDSGKLYKFYVRDNGIGISPEDQKNVFEIFKRLHASDEYKGTGAGLAIVKRIIDDHYGDIWIESEVGKGATFFFTIPKELKKKKKKLGQILVEDGFITEERLNSKLKKQQTGG